MDIRDVIELALGPEEAKHVNLLIPQPILDHMSAAELHNTAGWYFSPASRELGRLLSKQELWATITEKVRRFEIQVKLADIDVTYGARDWPCLRAHAERDEVVLIPVHKENE